MLNLGAINKITKEYISPNRADKKDKFICIECNNDVILKKGKIRIPHFSHSLKDIKCNFYNTNESQIHKNAKLILKYMLENHILKEIHRKCLKCNKITEFEIPEITCNTSIVIEYKFDYNGTKIADVAYINNVDVDIIGVFEVYYTHNTSEENRPEPWFELDAIKIIESINTQDLNNIKLSCIRNKVCEDCYKEDEKGIIYFNQRGAGCGKTYESIQLIERDVRFTDKKTYIYLTKMHSAKEVIYSEFKQQELKGFCSLKNLEHNDNGKQYKISYIDTKLNKEISIIIGTIDSFNYSIVNKHKLKNEGDYFKEILKTIKNGHISVNNDIISYGGITHKLNKECLIIIDEAQDLGKDYIEAFNIIISKTNIDVYVIGDKLQSIWGDNNIHTHIDTSDLDTSIERSVGINKVMRFHNKYFIEFVNDIIPFQKYNLPSITEICDGNCKYLHEDIKPYNIFEVPRIYSNDYDYDKMDMIIEQITSYMDIEIKKYNYLPNNFMFIFPVVSNNTFARMIEMRLQKYWINKFKDPNYIENILKANEYWKNKINDNKYYKYIYYHKSDEGNSINLKESENATRILSIHSSKGNGCEVVFLFGVTEASLTLYSKSKCNLVYDSLLHVAITRQKKSIYIGLEAIDDDIYNRFKNYEIIKNEKMIPDIKCINTTNICENIIDYIDINKILIKSDDYKTLLKKQENKKNIIDFGHHMIINSVMRYYIQLHLNGKQFYAIFNEIKNLEIKLYKFIDYKNELKVIDNIRKGKSKDKNVKIFPILVYDENENTQYYKYSIILKAYSISIIKKLNLKFHRLCPIECIILLFIDKIIHQGSNSDISITDIFSIMHSYDLCCDKIDKHHTDTYKCICKENFIETNVNKESINISFSNSIVNHYDSVKKIEELVNKYKIYVKDNFGNIEITYNITQHIRYGNKKDINIFDIIDIIGYSDLYVIHFVLKPQFNELNYNDIMCKSILDNFIIQNQHISSEKNYAKYNGKEIYTCIFSLNYENPIIFKLNIDTNIMKDYLKSYILNKYSNYANLIYKYYKHCSNNKPEKINSIIYTIDQLKLHDEKKPLPSYILDFFKYINKEIDDCKYDKIRIMNVMSKLNDESMFVQNINNNLEKFIDIMLQINVSEFIDF